MQGTPRDPQHKSLQEIVSLKVTLLCTFAVLSHCHPPINAVRQRQIQGLLTRWQVQMVVSLLSAPNIQVLFYFAQSQEKVILTAKQARLLSAADIQALHTLTPPAHCRLHLATSNTFDEKKLSLVFSSPLAAEFCLL